MKLYREVKASAKGDIRVCTGPNEQGMWPDIFFIEPIEITEGWINDIINSIAQDDEYGEFGRSCARSGMFLVLSKLKGE